jgi:glycosyltransferase involved in cell wall biosynthesis
MRTTKPRVCIVTAGHMSTCPRMLKAADAMHAAGYDVRVVSASHTPWAVAADRELRATRSWRWTVLDYSRATARLLQIKTGARMRIAHVLTRTFGSHRAPAALFVHAYSRAHDELVRAIAAEPADFVYGGTTGALAAVAEAADRLGTPYGLDLEDFHTGERSAMTGELNVVAERVERLALPGAAFLTTSSPMIADAYAEKYGLRPRTIHNTFSLDLSRPQESAEHRPWRFYWFSQTLGSGRGLEDFIPAAGRAGIAGELHLRARAREPYLMDLMRLARDTAPLLSVTLHEPAGPDAMVSLARGYDLGLSGEEPTVLNRRLCLGNKIFTYLAAGVPVLLSATPAQSQLGSELGDAAMVYESGDVAGLAERLSCLASDERKRARAKEAARAAAVTRWHWEHPLDRGVLLDAIGAVLPRPSPAPIA